MNYAEFVSDLPADHLSFSCVEENEEVLKRYGVKQEERQLGTGRFQSDLAAINVDEMELYSDRFDTAVSLYCQPPQEKVALFFTRSTEGEYFANGVDVARGGFAFIPDGCGPDVVAKGLFGSDTIIMPEGRFDNLFNTLCPDVDRPDIMTVLPADNDQAERLKAGIVALINDPAAEPQSAINLMEATTAFMGESLRRREFISPNNLCRRRIAKHAQAFIEARYADPIHIEDLCRATGAGVRTLQRAFRGYFDITITEYLKTKRLDMAFRALSASLPCERTITEIALAHGFGHLGRFSVLYGDRFGESPSTTLASSPTFSEVG